MQERAIPATPPPGGRARTGQVLSVYQCLADREALLALVAERGGEVTLSDVARDVVRSGLDARPVLARVVLHLLQEESRALDEGDLPPRDRGDRLRVVSAADAARARLLEEVLDLYAVSVLGQLAGADHRVVAERRARAMEAVRADLGLPRVSPARALGILTRAVMAEQLDPTAEAPGEPDPLDDLEWLAVAEAEGLLDESDAEVVG